MKKDDFRRIEYDFSKFTTKEPKRGLFHSTVLKSDGEGGQFVMVVIETEEGLLKEVNISTVRFID